MTGRGALWRRETAGRAPSTLSVRELLLWILSYTAEFDEAERQADRLLARCGTISDVLTAPDDELSALGLSPAAVQTLRLTADVRSASAVLSFAGRDGFDRADATGRFLCEMFLSARRERVGVLLFDERMKPIRAALLGDGSANAVVIEGRRIVDLALRCGAARVVIAHNHPHGTLLPSEGDVENTERLKAALDGLGVTLVEHFIVCGGHYRPMMLFESRLGSAAPHDYYDTRMHMDCRRERGV